MKTLSLLFILVFSVIAQATPKAVLLIRHGEELKDSNPNLSPKGQRRAEAIPRLLERPELKKFGTPELLYAAAPTDRRPSLRSVQTITPLALFLDLGVNVAYSRDDEEKLAESLLEKKKSNGKFVVVAWSHSAIPKIAANLGVENVPEWDGDTFDRMWLIEFTDSGVKLHDLPQRLLQGDSAH